LPTIHLTVFNYKIFGVGAAAGCGASTACPSAVQQKLIKLPFSVDEFVSWSLFPSQVSVLAYSD